MSLILTLVALLSLTNSPDPEKPYALAQSDVLDRGSFALYWRGARIGDEHTDTPYRCDGCRRPMVTRGVWLGTWKGWRHVA